MSHHDPLIDLHRFGARLDQSIRGIDVEPSSLVATRAQYRVASTGIRPKGAEQIFCMG
jgi:hypothetical protein